MEAGRRLDLLSAFHERLGERADGMLVPPPSFETMKAEFLDFDEKAQSLTARFPVLHAFLNPHRTMQGGFIAAAVDNTLGPLCMLLAPPNVTRRLEMKYRRPVTEDMGAIIVEARVVERRDPALRITAEVRAEDGEICATAKVLQWILPGTEA